MSSTPVNIAQAKALLPKAFMNHLMPMIHGSPAIGKSALVHQVAAEYNLKVIDVRLSSLEPTDFSGFPLILDNGKSSYRPFDTFPIAGDPIPEGYEGWLIFCDEFNSASQAVQKAAYRLVLDRQVGQFDLHEMAFCVGAGNLETDNAIVETMPTPLQSRMVHLQLEVDPELWLQWAMENQFDHRITSYIKYKPNNLYAFNPDHTDYTYPSPRTWEFTNRFTQEEDENGKLQTIELNRDMLPLLAGTVSEGVAREFLQFTKIYKDLITIDQIVKAPSTIKVPEEPSVLYALTGSLAAQCDDSNIKPLMAFIDRLPSEFQVICLRGIIKRTPAMLNHSEVQQWKSKNASEFF